MNRYTAPVTIFLFANGIFQAGAAVAAEIYKWVGSDGLTHYSETLPESDLASVEILETAVVSRAPAPPRNIQSMLDVAKSLETSRLERERLRLEERKIFLQNARPPVSDSAASTYYPAYYGSPYRYRYRHYYPYRRYAPAPRPHVRHGYPPHGGKRGVNARAYMKR